MRKVFAYIKKQSERLPEKNFLDLNGKPLWKWLIEELCEFDLYVNTDSKNLYNELKSYAHVTPIIRSKKHVDWEKHAKDLGSPAMDMVKEYCEKYLDVDEDFAVVHVTSPFLRSTTLKSAFTLFEETDCHSVHSVKKIQDFMLSQKDGVVTPENFKFAHISRTQDLDPLYQSLGAFFILNSTKLHDTNYQRLMSNSILYPISEIEAIEIDEEDDFNFAKIVAHSLIGESK